MNDGVTCDMTEVVALAGVFGKVAAVLPAAVDTVVVGPAAEELKRSAQADAPVLTGKLRASITVSDAGPGSKIVGTDVPYARFQEFGTSKMSPHPFMFGNADRAAVKMAALLVKVADPFDP